MKLNNPERIDYDALRAMDFYKLKRVGVLLTAHPRQQKWWFPVLLSLECYPGPLILAYDDTDTSPIPPEILERFERVVVTGYRNGFLKHAKGELICMREGFAAAAGLDIDYVLKLGFDEPIWRWRNITQLIEIIETEKVGAVDHRTRAIFGDPKLFVPVMNVIRIEDRGRGSAESYWRGSCGPCGVKRKLIDDRQWWEDTLGLRHLQGEYAKNLGLGNGWSWNVGEIWPRKI